MFQRVKPQEHEGKKKMTLARSIKLAKAAVNIFMVRSVLCTIYMQLAGLREDLCSWIASSLQVGSVAEGQTHRS